MMPHDPTGAQVSSGELCVVEMVALYEHACIHLELIIAAPRC